MQEISQKKLTSDRNELMYNFLLVIRALIANKFCSICDCKGRELGGRGRALGDNKPYQ